jgi:hypothetical protein
MALRREHGYDLGPNEPASTDNDDFHGLILLGEYPDGFF